MFQSFTASTSASDSAPRLADLRKKLAKSGVSGFIVPRSDAHCGENVAPRDERLAWLTGFTGSAGQCIVLADQAAIFIDGRYTLQVRSQTDGALFSYHQIPQATPAKWLTEALPEGGRIGFDPWLHGQREIEALEKALTPKGITLEPLPENPVDSIWPDQPAPPLGKVAVFPDVIAGKTHASKRQEIAGILKAEGVVATVLTLPDSIAWLLNIRGSDIARTPVALGFAILHADATVLLFMTGAKLDEDVRAHLGPDVTIAEPEAFPAALAALTGRVALDPGTAPLAVKAALSAEIHWMRDPCILPKACKTQAELASTREAHLIDAVAMARFLAWLDEAAPSGGLTEIDAVRELESLRRAGNTLQDISFETISGAGPNGAIVHYRVTEDSNRPITPGDLLLIDSGGQYLEGTTDITRTVATGPVQPEARRAFTLVLKGMIAMSQARWPEGLAGRDLDALARIALWQAGMDYDHGTGHGVGVYLSVHEGPQSLSRRGTEALKPGMILSNEPGYYREGAFGIRIENLLVVEPPETPSGGDRAMLGFETITFAPIDRRLIDPDLLSTAERDWLNAYHARTAAIVSPRVDDATAVWLTKACAPL
ncbi:aminopeptidase P family protein [Algicella marina]|uniref:M24 family metallopeptidase n=1 Tax=Algicella marina TaxID=2683284 RepID=A0A6P1SX12_9RHOB|nr:aminopeptidase P family protein [Algicella marina]QHQ34065.1 M24 family metallopeptidase [Algicella marina]